MKRTKTYFFFIVFSIWSISIIGQSIRVVNDTIITNLIKIAEGGNKRSLRDLGTFLNHPTIKSRVQKILKRLSFFHDDTIFDSKEKFLTYYYKNEKNIKYDQLVSVFHDTNRKNIRLQYKFQTINYPKLKEENLAKLDPIATDEYIDKITSIDNDFSIKKLFELYLNNINSNKLSTKNLDKIFAKLASKPNISTLITLTESANNSNPSDVISKLIEKISLIERSANIETKEYIESVDRIIDSIGNIKNIRLLYYQNKTKISPNFYYDNVDYLGHLLLFPDVDISFNDIVIDLELTQNARSLYYLAAYVFQQKDNKKNYTKAIKAIEYLTGKRLGVYNKNNQIVFDHFDISAFKNYLIYWSENADSYSWVDDIGKFIHEKDLQQKTATYDSNIHLLLSKNDSIARAAYLKLTHGDPEKISALINKIKPKQSQINHVIPNLKYKYLEQLTILNKYTYENGLDAPIRFRSQLLLDALTKNISPYERYYIENQIVAQFSFSEITALEKSAILYANNKIVNLSISRILDAIYSKYWNSILSEMNKLSFFLKKSFIFSKIGVSGTSQNYLNKFTKQNLQSPTLKRLYIVTQDEDIKSQIQKLFIKFQIYVNTQENNSDKININIQKLVNKNLNKLTKNQIKLIFKTIEENQNNDEIVDYLFEKLNNKPNTKLAKPCLKLALKKQTSKSIKDKLADLLNRIYDENQEIDFWTKLWIFDKKGYKVWGQKLLDAKVNLIQNKERLSPKTINQILQSKYFTFDEKIICLKNIHKIPSKKIKHLKFVHLNPKEDLSYFTDLKIPIKDLDNIVLFFDAKTEKQQRLLIGFLISKTKDSPISKKAKLLNNLFRQPFFTSAIENGVLTSEQIDEIKSILHDNLENSEYISEYEEELTISNISKLDFSNKNIIEQIKMSTKIDYPDNIIAKLQYEILSKIDLNDVVYVLPYFHLLSISENHNPKEFLYNDFGIPIFEPYSPQQLDDLANLLETGDRYEMYFHFLKLNKIDFTGIRGNLDFDKIYNLLKFGVSTTFCSSSGGVDDYFTYSIIKLLEFHFKTRLGFHKKLNENQTFYVFTAFSRARRWIKYLEDNRLIQKGESPSNSFNHVR